MRHKRTFMKGASVLLAASQCVTPALAAAAGVWEVKDGNWMYRNEDGTYQANAWIRDPSDNRLYHVNETGVMDTGWKCIDNIWYFFTNEHNGFYGAALENTWAWVDGYCYYFGAEGRMSAACVTADGFTVNESGQWTEKGAAVYLAGRGYQTGPAGGSGTGSGSGTAKRSSGGGSSGGGGGSSSGKGSGSGSSSAGSGSSSGDAIGEDVQDPGNADSGKEEAPTVGSDHGGEESVVTYSYTVRYVDDDGNLLASYERMALRDSIVAADTRTFPGYEKAADCPESFHLTMDHAVFVVTYRKEPESLLSYRIHYVDTDGKVLASQEGKAASGSEILIEEKRFAGYTEKAGQDHSVILNKEGSIFCILYDLDEAENTELSYTIQHIGPRNEVLLQVPGTGKAGDTIPLTPGSFPGYEPAGTEDGSAVLTMEGQVFTVYYSDPDAAEEEAGDVDNSCTYTVYYLSTDDQILETKTGEGTAGDVITIEALSFDGYNMADGQELTKTLPAGPVTFSVLYSTVSNSRELNYRICYAAMDNTVLKEITGQALYGSKVLIPAETFDGYTEIENQDHEMPLTSDGEVFYIKYEENQPIEDEEEEEEEGTENPGDSEEGNAGGEDKEEEGGQKKFSYSFIFRDQNGSQIGSKTGTAASGAVLSIPEIILDGYEIDADNENEYILDEDGQTMTISCTLSALEGEPENASENEPDRENTAYYYLVRYCDRDTGELIASESGMAYSGTQLTSFEAPDGYTLAEDTAFTVEASEDARTNRFTVWCINNDYILPEGSVTYTVSCVDPDGNILKTFTDTVLSGTVISPAYEIYGYDMDTEREYAFTVTEENFTFEVLYIPYTILDYEFRVTDIDTGEVLLAKTMEGRAGSRVEVLFTAEDFAVEGYDLLSTVPESVKISSNPANNTMNLYVKKAQEPVEIEEIRTYVVHFVSYHDHSVKIFDDQVGTAAAGTKVTASFLTKVSRADGVYEAIAQGDTLTFTINAQMDVNEFYVYFYKTEEYDNTSSEVSYSIQLKATDTGSTLNVMTGVAKPGTRIYYRNTFPEYAFRTDDANFFVVTNNTDENYVTVPMYRIAGNPPAINGITGKYDSAEWLMTFTDELGNLLLPWRTGFTRKGDTLYVDYPDTVYGDDGSVYRVMQEGPYVEYMNGTVYRQYNIKYKKGNESESLLEKWQKEAQAAFDAICRTIPYEYKVVYREEDSWNDIAAYSGVGKKGETISIQGISIPGYTVPSDILQSFVLDEDKKQVTVYCESIDGIQSVGWEKNDYKIRFTDGKGTDVLEPVSGYMAFETGNSYSYMTLHYPNTFRDKNGDIWEADEKGPKQLTMWNLDANQFEITYHRYYQNGYENYYADCAEDAQRLLTEMAVYTIDAEKHSYIVIGRDYDPTCTEVSSIVSRYDIANYATEKLDEFILDGTEYSVTRVTFSRIWRQETCTHDMEITKEVSAGCEVTGMITRTCKKCGYSETTYFQAVGHVDADRDGMCDNCGTLMAMNIGDEITVTWNPGKLDKEPLALDFICIDTDYKGSGKKLLVSIDAIPPEYYGSYSQDGHADYFSSDLRYYLEDEFLDGLSNRDVLESVNGRTVGLLTPEEYAYYKAQAVNVYKFPTSLTVLKEESGEDGLVALSNGSRVTPEEAGTKPVRPVIFLGEGGATEGVVSGRWNVGDYQSRQIGDKSYLFRCVNDNYKDNSNLDKTLALFVCDTVIPSYEGLGFNSDDSKRDTRFFGENNNYRYSNILQFLTENQRETGNLVTMDIGIANEYEGSTARGSFETLEEKDLIKHKRSVAQYLEAKLFIPSVEEALDMRDYLWKFDRSEKDNIESVYDGNYLSAYWLRTPVYGTADMVYTVNLKNGTIEPHSVGEEYAIPGTSASMEYSADNGNSWISCTDANTVVPALGTYLVRGKASGQSVTPILSGGMYVLTETSSSQEYSADGGATWKACSDGTTAVGVSSACLIRAKSASFQVNVTSKASVLGATGTDMEWSANNGATWNPCARTYTEVPAAGTYLIRYASNPEGYWTADTLTRYRLTGASYGQEYSNDNVTWNICSDGATYVEEAGTYTVRQSGSGEDRQAVKQTCSVGIRPMYAVYQEK